MVTGGHRLHSDPLAAYEVLRQRVLAFVRDNEIGPVELARRLGYTGKSRSWGTLFIQGKKRIPIDRLDRAAEMLGIGVPELFVGRGPHWSDEAIAVARAYDACDNPRTRASVRVALGVEVTPLRKETPNDQGARPGRRTARRR